MLKTVSIRDPRKAEHFWLIIITANIESFIVLNALLILSYLTLYCYPSFTDEHSEGHMISE